MIEVTKAATDKLLSAIEGEGKTVDNSFIRLYMTAG